jgi:drug/metabolite transporter (DMT)-like permease
VKNELLGTILAILTAVVSGFSIIANKVFIVDLDPAIFTFIRALFIGIFFFIISSFECKFDYKKFKKVSWTYLIVIGLIGGAIAFLFFFTGLKLTTGGRAAFLHKTLPIYATILAFIFLKEKITKKQVYALIVMLIGLILIVSSEINPSMFWTDPSTGDMLVIIATILWAIESVIAKRAMIKDESNFVVTFARMFFGAIFLFSIAVSWDKVYLLYYLTPYQIFSIFVSTMLLTYYVLLWYLSIKFINISKATTILLLAPVISFVAGVVVWNESFSYLQILGSGLILVGGYIISKIKSESLKPV